MVQLADLLHLSPHPEEAFLEFERVAREEMNRTIGSLGQNLSSDEPRLEYMSTVQAAFEEYGVEGVGHLGPDEPFEPDDFTWFNQRVKQVVTRLQVRALRRTTGELIELDPEDKASLLAEVGRLKNRVTRCGELTEDRKKALIKKIDELRGEIEKPRFSVTAFAMKVAAVSAAIVGVETAVIKGPETIVAVLDMVHTVTAKEAERLAILERYRRPPAIEHKPELKKVAAVPQDFSAGLDNEIPF